MGIVDDAAKETVNRLGPGAYLVNIVPSVVLVLITWALYAAQLMPWVTPTGPAPGAASVVSSARDHLGLAGGALLIVAVVVGAILLRPFQIAAVQLLEGYWQGRVGLRLFEALAVERQIRKFDAHATWRNARPRESRETRLRSVARASRQNRRRLRKAMLGEQAVRRYPLSRADFLPTGLGNVLRRAETTAGERYGLDTVVMYQRLYPYLSASVSNSIANRLDLIDTACTFVIVFVTEAVLSAPLIWRLDVWSVVPAVFVLFAAIAYRGARSVAERYGDALCVAFDLHRFDMVRALHRKLPRTPESELTENEELSNFLAQSLPWPKKTRRGWSYDHGSSGTP